MMGIFFEIDYTMLFAILMLAGILTVLKRWREKFAEPFLYFSSLSSWSQANKGRSLYARWPEYLLWIALFAFACAFIDPRVLIDKRGRETGEMPLQRMQAPTEGIAIYLVLDQSGSMKEEVPATIAGKTLLLTKIDLLKQITAQFIKGRPDDLIGLVFFARAARVMAPLTLDHQAILKELQRFNAVQDRDQDGTSIGYAIFKTVNLISATRHYAQELIESGEPAYTIKNSVIILITDGMQDPNPLDKGKRLRNMDVDEAATYAKAEGIRLYIVNVDPKLSTEEFAPYRHIMQRAAESTQGRFYAAGNTSNLEEIYRDINQLEKSVVNRNENIDKDKRPDLYWRIAFYPYLLALGLICILAAVVLETIVLRRIP